MKHAWTVTSAPGAIAVVREALSRTGWPLESAELSDDPSNMQVIEDPDTAKQILPLMAQREARDDVQRVSFHFQLPAPLMADLSSVV